MRKLTFLFIFLPFVAFGQNFVGHARAFVQRGISVSEASWLDFSNVTATGAGELTINLDGTSTITGNIGSRGTVSPAVLTITGMPNTYFVISLPTTATISCGSAQMYITGFVCNFANKVGKLDANGTTSLIIAAKLSVPESFSFGEFTGSYPLVINYQ